MAYTHTTLWYKWGIQTLLYGCHCHKHLIIVNIITSGARILQSGISYLVRCRLSPVSHTIGTAETRGVELVSSVEPTTDDDELEPSVVDTKDTPEPSPGSCVEGLG